ncbi:MAG: Asp-tRNA(Asn)/Glu-tRNA(Gln) amidotransferase subunit GatA [Candidatus Methanomethylophilaceae archaeon]|nr:Asp-tRNA(Asn)/Glu-tRNA(Gln) amidotransferase subunit GatA [Candidatus Methanomethylophilaceae archaeon]
MIGLDLSKLKSVNDKYGMFHAMTEKESVEGSFHFSAKDNLTSKDMETCSGSRILEGYRPAFDATAIAKMRAAGGELVGKTNMDEFGFGTFSANSGFEVPRNPFDTERACGGSSGGSACAAAVFEDHVSLGVSTGGSICCPASFCGVYGIAPTYGRVSRYGLIDYGNSLDKIGILSSKATDLRKYLGIIAGKDEKDPTSCVQPDFNPGYRKLSSVAVPKEGMEGLSKDVESAFRKSLETLESMGTEIEFVEMPSLKYAMPAYYVLATSEASTNLARYVGMRYGQQEGDLSLKFDDYFTSFRSEYFGDEAKRRILLGTFTRMVGFRDRYYAKALQVRKVVIDDYKRILATHDAVLAPTMPFTAPRFDDIANMSALDAYKADYLTIPANIAGTPHMSVPCGYGSDGMPIGMQFVADHWDEEILLSVAEDWEKVFESKKPEVTI